MNLRPYLSACLSGCIAVALAAPADKSFDAVCKAAFAAVDRQAKSERAARASVPRPFVFGLREGGSTYGLYESPQRIAEDPAIDAAVLAKARADLRAALPAKLDETDVVRLAVAELELEMRGGTYASREAALSPLKARPSDPVAVAAVLDAFRRMSAYVEMLSFAETVIAANADGSPLKTVGLGWRWYAARGLGDKTLMAECQKAVDALPLTDANIRDTYLLLLNSAWRDKASYVRLYRDYATITSGRSQMLLVRAFFNMASRLQDRDELLRWLPEMEKLGMQESAYGTCADVFARIRCWKEAEDYAARCAKLKPDDPACQRRLARAQLANGHRDAARATAEALAKNEKAKPDDRLAGRVLAAFATAQTPEALTDDLVRLAGEAGGKDGRESVSQLMDAAYAAFSPLMTSDGAKWLLAVRKALFRMMHEEERLVYTVRYRHAAPRTAGRAEAEGLFDPSRNGGVRVENRFARHETYSWRTKDGVLNNLKSAPKPTLTDVTGEGRSAEVVSVYDESGLHLYMRFRDPAAAKYVLGETLPATCELTVWSGEGGWNQVFTKTDAVKDLNGLLWDDLDYGHRPTFGSIVTDSTSTDEAFLFHTFVPWTHVYNRLPTETSDWRIVLSVSLPSGAFALGGGTVHELGRAMRLRFDMDDRSRRLVRRALVRRAATEFLRFKADWKNVDVYEDEVLGDPAFAAAVVKPWSEKAGRAAAAVLARPIEEMTDADIAAGEACLADWLDPQLRLNDLRVAWLEKGFFKEETK